MSTLVGHSVLQALHDRHRSSDCLTCSSCQPSCRRLRPAASRTACARGRACCAPPRASPCSSGTSCPRRACGIRRGRCSAATPSRTTRRRPETRSASAAAAARSRRRAAGSRSADTASTTLCGFSLLSGSQTALNSRNACISSGPNIFGSSAPRDWPSPCSPDSEPP